MSHYFRAGLDEGRCRLRADDKARAQPQALWQAEVAKMRNVYKAPVADKDVPDIVAYLTAVKGSK